MPTAIYSARAPTDRHGANTIIGIGTNQTISSEYGDFTSFANGSTSYSLYSDGQSHTDLITGFVQGTDHLSLTGFSNVAAYGFSNETVVLADNTTINIFGVSTNNVSSLS